MVKKNRRPRTKQTKSQLKRKKADQHTGFVRVNHKFGNETIAKNWDRRLTLNQNFERMGLVADANSDFAQANSSRAMVKRLTKSAIVGASIENAELEKQKKAAAEQIISELQASADAPRVPIPKGLSVDDQQILRKLMAKHGEDYEAMARDHKLNVWQKTTTQLRKQVEVYKKLLEM